MTLFEALKDFISVLKSHLVEGWMTYKSSIIEMSTTELTITWILEKEFILTKLNMKWTKPFAFSEGKTRIQGPCTISVIWCKIYLLWKWNGKNIASNQHTYRLKPCWKSLKVKEFFKQNLFSIVQKFRKRFPAWN